MPKNTQNTPFFDRSSHTFNVDIATTFRSDAELISAWINSKSSLNTKRLYTKEAYALTAHLGPGKSLRTCTTIDLHAYIDGRHLLGASSGTTKTTRAVLSSLFRFATATNYISKNPSLLLPRVHAKSTLPERILSEEEVGKILYTSERALSDVVGIVREAPRNHAIISFLYISALRVSELTRLRWRNLRPARKGEGAVLSVFGKGGKTRTIKIDDDIFKLLLSIRGEARDADYVFRSTRKPYQKLSEVQVFRIVRATCARAGIFRKVSPHWFRHAFATHAVEGGCPLHELQAYLGHSSIATTGRYLHAAPKEATSRFLRKVPHKI